MKNRLDFAKFFEDLLNTIQVGEDKSLLHCINIYNLFSFFQFLGTYEDLQQIAYGVSELSNTCYHYCDNILYIQCK